MEANPSLPEQSPVPASQPGPSNNPKTNAALLKVGDMVLITGKRAHFFGRIGTVSGVYPHSTVSGGYGVHFANDEDGYFYYPTELELVESSQLTPTAAPSSTPTPSNNPKTAAGSAKVPLHQVPPVSLAYLACAHENGAIKYGFRNWRDEPIDLLTYVAAALRHWDYVLDGEWIDSDSGLPHLAHAMACASVVLDAHASGTLIDNTKPGKAAEVLAALKAQLPELRARWKAAGERQYQAALASAPSHATDKELK